MYSHYSNYNQNGGVTTVSAQQPGLTWDGSKWIQSNSNVASSTYSTYTSNSSFNQSYQQNSTPNVMGQQQQQQQQQQKIAENPVQTYTQYYHSWTAQAQEEEKRAASLPLDSAERVKTQRLADWAKYYADQSSRAAHHFYQNPNATYTPFDLPPTPPDLQQQQSQQQPQPQPQQQQSQQLQQQQQQQQQQQSRLTATPTSSANNPANNVNKVSMTIKHHTKTKPTGTGSGQAESKSTASSSDHPPDALKRYVHRCLKRCTTKEQENAMQKEIELVIACALQDGTLDSTDWLNKEPIKLPGEREPQAKKLKLSHSDASMPAPTDVAPAVSGSASVSRVAGSAYGSRASVPSSTPAFNDSSASNSWQRDQKVAVNNSYYGPSSNQTDSRGATSNNRNRDVPSSFANPSFKNPSFENSFRKQELAENDSYYGHSSKSQNKHDHYYGNANAVQSKPDQFYGNSNTMHNGRNNDGNMMKYGPQSNSTHEQNSKHNFSMHKYGPQSHAPSDRNPQNNMNKYGPQSHASDHDSQSNFRGQQLLENNSYYGNPVSKKRKSNKTEKDNYNAKSTEHLKTNSHLSYTNPHQTSGHHSSPQQQLPEEDFIELGPASSKNYKGNKKGSSSFRNEQQKHQSNLNMSHKVSFDSSDTDSSVTKSPKGQNGLDRSRKALEKRANRFKGSVKNSKTSSPVADNHYDKYMGKETIGGSRKVLDEVDYEKMTVKGTCQTLEKKYLRLTAPPRPELVRPQPILERHLHNLKLQWKSDGKKDYNWFCSQFKAVRQDCTVQRIVNEFTVDVYETHARIALEQGDLNEYNQCQTQLKELYANASDPGMTKNCVEFIAYRLIYYVFLTGNKKYDGGSSDMFKIMLSLTSEQRQEPVIKHALNVRSAVADGDYHKFFLLRKICPNHGSFLMDFMIPNIRFAALQRMGKAYRPSVEVDFILKELGFESDLAEGKKWLLSCNCILSNDETTWNTKDSVVHESDMTKSKSSLI